MSPGSFLDRIRKSVNSSRWDLARLSRALRKQARLWQFCARRLRENNLTAMGAALSFQTIFALIPTLVLTLLVAKSLGALEDRKTSFRRFLVASGFAQIAALEEPDLFTPPPEPKSPDAAVPSTAPAGDEPRGAAPTTPTAAESSLNAGDKAAPPQRPFNVTAEIDEILGSVEEKLTLSRIGPVGAVLFIWTALTLLMTVEQSLNRVFQAARSRSMARRVLLYWSVMTLGPVALMAATYLGERALRSFEHVPVLSLLFTGVGRMGPVLVGMLTLAAVYILMPNTSVNRRAAFGGAVVAVLLWLAAKWAFSLYVERFIVQGDLENNLYGILGVFPLFLLWLHLSWMIFLFGAELAHTAASYRQIWKDEEVLPSFVAPADGLAVTLAVARAFQNGEGAIPAHRIAAMVRLPGEGVQWLLDRLAACRVVCAVNGAEEQRYVLARAPDAVSVSEILELGERRMPPAVAQPGAREPSAVAAEIEARMRSSVADLTVADLLDGPAGGTGARAGPL